MANLSSVGIIGAGKVGSAIISHLNTVNLLKWAVSIDFPSHILNDLKFDKYYSIQNIRENKVDCIVIATQDSEIANISAHLTEIINYDSLPKVVCHLSGAIDCSVLSQIARKGVLCFSAHPMQTFGVERSDIFDNIAWGIESDENSRDYAIEFVKLFNGIPILLSNEIIKNKPIYHIIGVSAANFMQATIAFASMLARNLELDEQKLLQSILKVAFDNAISAIGTNQQIKLTGPIARGDFQTITNHLAALSNSERFSSIYKNFSRALTGIASADGIIDSENYNKINNILK